MLLELVPIKITANSENTAKFGLYDLVNILILQPILIYTTVG